MAPSDRIRPEHAFKGGGGGADISLMTLRRRARTDDGFALLEALAAIALAAIAVAGITATMATTSTANQTSRATSGAVAFARTQLESARTFGYDDLAHLTGSHIADPLVVGGMFDPDYEDPGTNGPLAAEPVIYEATGLPSLDDTLERDGITFSSATYLTQTATAAKRVTVLVSWTQQGVGRTTSLSTLVSPPASPLSAAADAFTGTGTGGAIDPVVSARARRGGGLDEEQAASFSPLTGWTVTGALARAEVEPSVRHAAHLEIGSLSISHEGITITASGLTMDVEALPAGATSTTVTGTISVNGIQYVDPAPGLEIPVGSWTVGLNSQQTGADGSSSASFIRLSGPAGEDLRLGWAWVSPVTPW